MSPHDKLKWSCICGGLALAFLTLLLKADMEGLEKRHGTSDAMVGFLIGWLILGAVFAALIYAVGVWFI